MHIGGSSGYGTGVVFAWLYRVFGGLVIIVAVEEVEVVAVGVEEVYPFTRVGWWIVLVLRDRPRKAVRGKVSHVLRGGFGDW
jgi:hypothetical protein